MIDLKKQVSSQKFKSEDRENGHKRMVATTYKFQVLTLFCLLNITCFTLQINALQIITASNIVGAQNSHQLNDNVPPTQLFVNSIRTSGLPAPIQTHHLFAQSARQSKRQEEEEENGGFIMKTPTALVSESSYNQRQLPTTTLLEGEGAGELSTATLLPIQTTSTTRPEEHQTNHPVDTTSDDGRIAINSTRQQFATHDQLFLSAGTKDELIDSSSSSTIPSSGAIGSSRSGMQRLAFASSFLNDFLFRSRAPAASLNKQELVENKNSANQQQHQQLPQTAATTTTTTTTTQSPTSTSALNTRQQQQQVCPATCVNIFVASLRCRNVIAASCPGRLQRCCEVDDVSFNGTPVQTSPPLLNADSDSHPAPPNASLSNNSSSSNDDHTSEPPVASPTTRAPQQATAAAATTTTDASYTSDPSHLLSTNEQRGQQQQPNDVQLAGLDTNTRPVYFLSSSGGDHTSSEQPQHNQSDHDNDDESTREQPLDDKLVPAGTSNSGAPANDFLAQPVAGRPLQQQPQTSASVDREQFSQATISDNSAKQQSAASQSFDTPLTTTTTTTTTLATTTASTLPPTLSGRPQIVVIQTANGTAYMHSTPLLGQQAASNSLMQKQRPLYANWTDYQLLKSMHTRQQPAPVVYHSNIDPVKRLASTSASPSSSSAAAATANDLNKSSTTPDSVEAIKVVSDQHSSQVAQSVTPMPASTSTLEPVNGEAAPSIDTQSNQTGDTATTTTADSSTSFEDQNAKTPTTAAASSDSSAVNGIVTFLGSLFETFVAPSAASGANDNTNQQQFGVDEARVPPASSEQPTTAYNVDPQQQQQQQHASDSSLVGDLLSSLSSFAKPQHVSITSEQQPQPMQTNDRRLGLDSSSRTQNDTIGGANQPDVAPSNSADLIGRGSGGGAGCTGSCHYKLFASLCDETYPSPDCGPSQDCCVQSLDQQQQQQAAGKRATSGQQQQQCAGTCLPIYHMSLCMKPNEVQMDSSSSSSSCLPNHFCCAQASTQATSSLDTTMAALDGNNHLDSETGDTHHLSSAYEPVQLETDAASAHKEQSLSVALVPPPPPTLLSQQPQQQQVVGQYNNVLEQSPGSWHTSQHPPPPQLLHTTPRIALVAPTSRPQVSKSIAGGGGQTLPQASQSSSSGIMNQLFSMFKSNTGIGKQRVRPLATNSINHLTSAQPFIYELAPAASQTSNNYVTTTAAQVVRANPHQAVVLPAQQQVVFQSRPQQQPVGGPMLLAPNGQPFLAQAPHNSIVNNQQQQYLAHDPAQLAAMFQKQFAAGQVAMPMQVAPVRHQQQQQQQPLPNIQQVNNNNNFNQQQQMLLMAASQQANFINQQQKVNQAPPRNVANQIQTPATSVGGGQFQQTTRWTHLGQQTDGLAHNDNAQTTTTTNMRQQHQQQQNNFRQQQQQQHFAHQQAIAATPASLQALAFGPSDASKHFGMQHNGNQPQQQQHNFRPLVQLQQMQPANQNNKQQHDTQLATTFNHNNHNKQLVAWTGSGAQDHHTANRLTNVEQPKRPEAADANVVVAIHGSSSNKLSSPTPINQQQAVPAKVTPAHDEPGGMSLASSVLNAVHSDQQPPNLTAMTTLSDTSDESSHSSSPVVAANDEPITSDETSAGDSPPAQELCRSSCLSALVSFNCVHPNYLDSSLLCPSEESICCVKVAHNKTVQADASIKQVAVKQPPSELAESSTQLAATESSETLDADDAPAHSDTTSQSVAATDDIDQQRTSSVQTSRAATACGLPGPSRLIGQQQRTARVMGGKDSTPGYWCWQAALMNDRNEYLCGGALIGTKWVLTAAHCVTQHLRSGSALFVRLGEWNLNITNARERRHARTLLVKTSYVHHNHNSVTLDNDIALLRLDESLDLSREPAICTVCLPERNSKTHTPDNNNNNARPQALEAGRRCTVTGYGFEHEQGPAALRVRESELPIVSDAECQNKTSVALEKAFTLPASSFCAGGELGEDACHGDGGSPLVCLVDGLYELAGIVSWGYKCGQRDLPGLYAKVSNFVGWINQIVSVNS